MADAARSIATLERGRIAFVMRPRVEAQPGVQGFALVLSAERGGMHRRVAIGKKRMPAPGSKEREWAFVDRVAETAKEAFGDLGPRTYATKTRGLRHQPAARIVARGRYAIIAHDDHTHLSYELDDGENDALQEVVEVRRAGSIIVAVFNPVAKWSARATLRYGGNPDDPAPFAEPSLYPDDVQERFGKKRFLPLVPEFLDYEGAELVLIGAEDELRPELAEAV